MVQIPTGRHRPSAIGIHFFAYVVCRIKEVSLQDTTEGENAGRCRSR